MAIAFLLTTCATENHDNPPNVLIIAVDDMKDWTGFLEGTKVRFIHQTWTCWQPRGWPLLMPILPQRYAALPGMHFSWAGAPPRPEFTIITSGGSPITLISFPCPSIFARMVTMQPGQGNYSTIPPETIPRAAGMSTGTRYLMIHGSLQNGTWKGMQSIMVTVDPYYLIPIGNP